MHKSAPNTGVFVNRILVKKLKSLAADRARRLGETTDLFVRHLLDSVDRNERLSLVLPDLKKETRKDTGMVLVDKELLRRVRLLSFHRDTTVRALVRLAIEEGLELEARQPGAIVSKTLQKGPASTRAVHHDAEIVDALKTLAQQRGISVVGLADAVLRTVVQTPSVLDSFDLPPIREIPVAAAANAAARRAIELAAKPRRNTRNAGRKVKGRRGSEQRD